MRKQGRKTLSKELRIDCQRLLQEMEIQFENNDAIRSVKPETHQELRWHLEFELQKTSLAVCSLSLLMQ